MPVVFGTYQLDTEPFPIRDVLPFVASVAEQDAGVPDSLSPVALMLQVPPTGPPAPFLLSVWWMPVIG